MAGPFSSASMALTRRLIGDALAAALGHAEATISSPAEARPPLNSAAVLIKDVVQVLHTFDRNPKGYLDSIAYTLGKALRHDRVVVIPSPDNVRNALLILREFIQFVLQAVASADEEVITEASVLPAVESNFGQDVPDSSAGLQTLVETALYALYAYPEPSPVAAIVGPEEVVEGQTYTYSATLTMSSTLLRQRLLSGCGDTATGCGRAVCLKQQLQQSADFGISSWDLPASSSGCIQLEYNNVSDDGAATLNISFKATVPSIPRGRFTKAHLMFYWCEAS
ncbi:hypothetical protein Vretimale_7753, partial [Volvox reticuliferus]